MKSSRSTAPLGTLFATLLLCAAALAGNYFELSISFSVSFIFGSVAALLALQFLGLLPGLTVAVVAGIYTWFHWGHPYALLVMCLEILCVSLTLRRVNNLVLADAAFWLIVGGPLVTLLYWGALDLSFDSAVMIALKQSANGVMNASIATFIVVGLALGPVGRFFPRLSVSYTGVVFAVLMFLVTVVGAVLIVLTSRDMLATEKQKMSDRLQLVLLLTREELLDAEARDTGIADLQAALDRSADKVDALIDTASGISVCILDAQGNLLAKHGEIYTVPGVTVDTQIEIQQWEPPGDMPALQRTAASRYVRFLPLELGGTSYVIAAESAVAPLVAKLTQSSRNHILALAMIMLASTVLVQLLSMVTTRTIRNLAQLSTKVSQAISAGDQNPPTFPKSNIQEYEMLSTSLREMSAQIARDFTVLSDVKDTLEHRVRLRTSQLKRLSQVASQTTNGVIITDVRGRTEWINEGLTRMSGFTLDQVKGKTPASFLHGAKTSAETIAQMNAALAREENFEAEILHYTRTGQEFWTEASCSALHDDRGRITGYMAVLTDVTELKQNAAKLERTLERLALALDVGHIGIWEWNIETNETFWDTTVYDIFGIAPGTTITADVWKSVVHADDVARNDQLLERALNTRDHVLEDEYRIHHKARGERIVKAVSRVVFDDQGRATRITGINFDVTEDRQTAIEIRELAEHTETVLDNIVDGIITIDLQGEILSFNAAAETIFGYHESEVVGQHFSVLLQGGKTPHLAGLIEEYRTMNPSERRVAREIQGRRKSGADFPLEFAFAEIRRDGQKVFVGIARDITERKRVERMTKEFISTINHELRTPLTSIQGSLKLIDSGMIGALPDKVKKMVSVSLRNSDRLRSLIDDMLDIDRMLSGKMRFDMGTHALQPLLEQVISDNQGYAGNHGIGLVLASAVPDVQISVDKGRFVQIMSNFISNAIKFSAPDGKVTVDVVGTGTDVTVHVIDEGCGIPEALHEQIFEQFFRVDSSDSSSIGGTGLGLSIAKALAEQMNATVGLSSVVGEGSDFWIKVPLEGNSPTR
ncbi:PAS domain S-box protein [Sulfitobacter pseudonitzschiae]|uniref:histidine kinase n=1 Tax=Pseudosulfitobacter pseudonitzschiae TaxID=1402135 RepID=A0A9Q2S020_9RHOB|nr:PAS domain S-box protein [Pseudosulfitobacter pseudonitzschiae]MBM2292118.1 PAS domain S-box protein [Pseudosulfitobacter pseudonitzschiae]MBM2297036.1 PAS domain S-box protein [Pseudosulfitobacter pseudonitzschiae]MBM2301950.1 PAS domain S-box protein [Pseudosulfitobacter pseudonitzschiae]MBM2311732.1 PAS domain S-box protein [Pseudosulfitobacter pseudonitzschiae]MBM2316646.1 PAS domain S-box protein [Pseudosulfitobacter pseudonitzschiae]